MKTPKLQQNRIEYPHLNLAQHERLVYHIEYLFDSSFTHGQIANACTEAKDIIEVLVAISFISPAEESEYVSYIRALVSERSLYLKELSAKGASINDD